MIAEPLPYDMGNSGDLIKHGMIAEFAKWWLQHNRGPFIFYDPFGGRPWKEPPHEKVVERLLQLRDCALVAAQPDPNTRYYGSGHIIKNTAHNAGRSAKVFVSDRNQNAIDDLVESGLERIILENFTSENAYSILDSNLMSNNASLILLDPFADFLSSSDKLLPEITRVVAQAEVAVALFVLYDHSMSFEYEKFKDLQKIEFIEGTLQFSISCPRLSNSEVKGEEKYCSDVILFLPANYNTLQPVALRQSLKQYAGMLTLVLGQEITFEELS